MEIYKNFWNLIKPDKNNSYLEIRITNRYNILDKTYYEEIKKFSEYYPKMIIKKDCQFFVKDIKEVISILEWNNFFFKKNCKICYGLNLRESNSILNLNGSYECVKNIRFVFFDIELASHKMPNELLDNYLEKFLSIIIEGLKKYKLKYPTIIKSGAGRHLLYKIKSTKLTEAKIRGYKSFISHLQKYYENNLFIIDNVKDFTRVFGLPGSINIKRNKEVTIDSIDYTINNEFKIKSKKKEKKLQFNFSISEWNIPKVKESLEWIIITHPKIPIGEIHTYVLFALKLLLKVKNVTNYKELEYEINKIRGDHHRLDPTKGTEGKDWNPAIIYNWCNRNKKWCETYNIQWKNYINRCKKNE